ncbi:hypothetical protein BIV57_22810 [Mangrovactinospora gilvigrisea]|uniref:Uncharacterized protein n=1 Tax=Mangrovactinospora gilvigrisea TaxID=1428644 RepID=A0A1J7B9A0_9ACTN|nr:hypothetical protein [Mangrovactinospora gilvigrisea]OIV35219.1 hypothetical protein BIV57_22810 [Mangrovactinospora gilvigrisea]
MIDEQRHTKSSATVGEVLDRRLEVNEVEESTRDRNGIAIRCYLKPTFGSVKAHRLEPEAVELY